MVRVFIWTAALAEWRGSRSLVNGAIRGMDQSSLWNRRRRGKIRTARCTAAKQITPLQTMMLGYSLID
jgi:hypothetical protein